jgi:hypothetical protein
MTKAKSIIVSVRVPGKKLLSLIEIIEPAAYYVAPAQNNNGTRSGIGRNRWQRTLEKNALTRVVRVP